MGAGLAGDEASRNDTMLVLVLVLVLLIWLLLFMRARSDTANCDFSRPSGGVCKGQVRSTLRRSRRREM